MYRLFFLRSMVQFFHKFKWIVLSFHKLNKVVNIWTIAGYHVTLCLIWKKFTAISRLLTCNNLRIFQNTLQESRNLPQAYNIVGCPTHDKNKNNNKGHFQCASPCSIKNPCAGPSQTVPSILICFRITCKK
jgi:hypothetical protein